MIMGFRIGIILKVYSPFEGCIDGECSIYRLLSYTWSFTENCID